MAADIAQAGDLAASFKVDRSTVYYWISRPGFPKPIAELRAGRVWDLEAVRQWKAANIRDRAEPGEGRGRG